MIEPKRLEELIEDKAKVWVSWNEVIQLDPNNCYIEPDLYDGRYYLFVKDNKYCPCYCLDDLREDVDRAKWEYEIFTTRTERFEPPMWDDIEHNYEFNFINDCGDYFFTVIKNCSIEIIIHRKSNKPTHYEWLFSVDDEDVTKENYEKACEIVRDLFVNNK